MKSIEIYLISLVALFPISNPKKKKFTSFHIISLMASTIIPTDRQPTSSSQGGSCAGDLGSSNSLSSGGDRLRWRKETFSWRHNQPQHGHQHHQHHSVGTTPISGAGMRGSNGTNRHCARFVVCIAAPVCSTTCCHMMPNCDGQLIHLQFCYQWVD